MMMICVSSSNPFKMNNKAKIVNTASVAASYKTNTAVDLCVAVDGSYPPYGRIAKYLLISKLTKFVRRGFEVGIAIAVHHVKP